MAQHHRTLPPPKPPVVLDGKPLLVNIYAWFGSDNVAPYTHNTQVEVDPMVPIKLFLSRGRA